MQVDKINTEHSTHTILKTSVKRSTYLRIDFGQLGAGSRRSRTCMDIDMDLDARHGYTGNKTDFTRIEQ